MCVIISKNICLCHSNTEFLNKFTLEGDFKYVLFSVT